jgi:hypothetical protein
MRKLLLTLAFLPMFSEKMAGQANRCQILGIEHFGGNLADVLVSPYVITQPNGSFSLCISSNSDAGNVNLSCNNGVPSGGQFSRNYTANYSALVTETCAPIGSNFDYQTFQVYPQVNGDTILIGTRYDSLTSYDALIERRNGGVIWNKKYGGGGADAPATVTATSDGGFIITTGTNSADGDVGMHHGSDLTADTWVLRLDNNGDKLWSKVLGGTGTDLVRTVITSDDGGCYLFGVTSSSDHDATGMHGVSDLWIVKLDSAGNKQWHKCLGGTLDDGSGYDAGVFAIKDDHSGFYVLNRTSSQDGDIQFRKPFNDGMADYWLLHVDSLADIIWENTYGSDHQQVPTGLCQATDGSLWMVGYLNGPPTSTVDIPDHYNNQDGWVVHADASGSLINQRTLGTDLSERLVMIHPLPDGTVLVGGDYFYSVIPGDVVPIISSPGFPLISGGASDIFLAHLGPNSLSITTPDALSIDWELYPNPAKDEIMIKMRDTNLKDYSLVLTDASGKQLLKQLVKTALTKINTKQFADGIYYLKLTNSNMITQTKKIIIQH